MSGEDGDDDEQIDFDFIAAIAEYASEWVKSLNWDDLQSLSIFLWNLLLNVLESAVNRHSPSYRSSYW